MARSRWPGNCPRHRYALRRRRLASRAQATRQVIEAGDIDEALNAASQIGDDTLQRKASGTVQPDTFTHGTSAQRVHWFKQGCQAGQVEQCDTFKAASL